MEFTHEASRIGVVTTPLPVRGLPGAGGREAVTSQRIPDTDGSRTSRAVPRPNRETGVPTRAGQAMQRVLILGATGSFGQRIIGLALRHLPGVEIVQAARRARAGVLAVDVHDEESVRRALAGVRAVVNAVGPFEYDPAPVVTACLEAGCDYVDIAETPAFVAAARPAAST